jgi:hypothetical protein
LGIAPKASRLPAPTKKDSIMKTIRSSNEVVTVYVDRDDYKEPMIELSLSVRHQNQAFQCMLDKKSALELAKAIEELLEDPC